MCSLTCMSVVACVAHKLRPCPNYSRRRDRINLGLWRSLSAERWKVQQYVPTDRRMPSASIVRRSRLAVVEDGAVRRQHNVLKVP